MSLFKQLLEDFDKRMLLELQQEIINNDYLELDDVSINANGELHVDDPFLKMTLGIDQLNTVAVTIGGNTEAFVANTVKGIMIRLFPKCISRYMKEQARELFARDEYATDHMYSMQVLSNSQADRYVPGITIDIDKQPNIKFHVWYDKQDKRYVLTNYRADMKNLHGSRTIKGIIDNIKTLDPASAPYFK